MIGERLGPWIIEEEIGHGGMGSVWRARRADDAPGEPDVAAVKVLAPELAADPGLRERFQREIDILRRLAHPNIVKLLEAGTEGNHVWFAMEYVHGPSLETLREQRGRLGWDEVLQIALQVAPALRHAHNHGVIHRDLKPSNLILGPGSSIKLTDFGIASLFSGPHITVAGAVVGTAEYLSPEQAAGKQVTPRSDLYSLGVVLYTLIVGRTPFEGEVVDLLHKHRYAQPEKPSRFVPELPGDFEEIICELLEKEPSRRPPDAGVLGRRLEGLRRRMQFKSAQAKMETSAGAGSTPKDSPRLGEGPATLMSRLMRAELNRMNRGGPLRQFFNHPIVIVVLFALTLGTIIWTFWPLSAEALYSRGAALMESEEPYDWDRAWTEYLDTLERKYPDHPHKAEVAEFRQRRQNWKTEREAALDARRAKPMSEAAWFYQEGLRLRQRGNEAEARRVWQALIDSFGHTPTEGPWVRKAQEQLKGTREEHPVERWLDPLRDTVARARRMREEGKAKEADAILQSLRSLYHDDPAALEIIGKD
jgi:hypothetical protein